MSRPALLFIILLFLIAFALTSLSLPHRQTIPPVKRDDFNTIHSWWHYHTDGSASLDSSAIVNGKGYLRIRLKNPTQSEECNVGISDFQNIYGKKIKYLSLETRIKLLTPMKPGSRGWGFWKSRKKAKSYTLAWFMQQMDERNARLSWSMAGTIVGSRRNTKKWPVDNQWHIYRIERDLKRMRTRFWIDGKLFLETPDLAPKDRLSFHLWIDNQVYSRKSGIMRKAWQGPSEMVVDYVQIEAGRRKQLYPVISEAPFLFYCPCNRIYHRKENNIYGHSAFQASGGDVWILMTARVEDISPYDVPDRLQLFLGKASEPVLTFDGQVMKGKDQTMVVRKTLPAGEYKIHLREQSTPLIYDLAVVDGSKGKALLNMNGSEFLKQGPIRKLKINRQSRAALYLAVSAREAEANENREEDRLRLSLSGSSLSAPMAFNFKGNEQFGACKTVVKSFLLNAGTLKINVQIQGKPQFHHIFLLLKE